LIDFETLWQASLPLVDAVNYRRGGTSSVSILKLNQKTIYLKRQQNHYCKDSNKPWCKIPTLYREFKNLVALSKTSINTAQWVFYLQNKDKSMLAVEEIPEAVDLIQFYKTCPQKINQALDIVATAIADLHRYHWQHTALYPKHILIEPNSLRVSFIDLEGMRKRWLLSSVILRDLDTLNRHFQELSTERRSRFLKNYLRQLGITHQFRKLFDKLCKKYHLKVAKQKF